MKLLFRPWIILLILIIVIVAGVLLRGQPEAKKSAVVMAQETIAKIIGMKLETASSTGTGLKVEEVKSDSPAAELGIKVGDRIVAVGDRSVWHTEQFTQFANEFSQAGRPIPMLVESKGDYRLVVFGRPQGAASESAPKPSGGAPATHPAQPGETGP
jgi:membrane-associated protease RseP (regulator of RpoE activity)